MTFLTARYLESVPNAGKCKNRKEVDVHRIALPASRLVL